MTIMGRTIINKGALEYGEEPIVLHTNSKIWDDNKQPCPHCHSPIKVINTRSDGSTWDSVYWTNPFVAAIPYDGDCCHTEVCIKCLVDGIDKSGFDLTSIKEKQVDDFNDIPVFTEIRTLLLENQGWVGHEGCIWTKGNDRLAYEHDENNELNWNLNGNPIEFMEHLKQ